MPDALSLVQINVFVLTLFAFVNHKLLWCNSLIKTSHLDMILSSFKSIFSIFTCSLCFGKGETDSLLSVHRHSATNISIHIDDTRWFVTITFCHPLLLPCLWIPAIGSQQLGHVHCYTDAQVYLLKDISGIQKPSSIFNNQIIYSMPIMERHRYHPWSNTFSLPCVNVQQELLLSG